MSQNPLKQQKQNSNKRTATHYFYITDKVNVVFNGTHLELSKPLRNHSNI